MMNDFSAAVAAPDRKSVQIPLVDRVITTELSGDFSLPDYQPEIKRLLRIRADVLPPNGTTGAGGIGGMVDYYVLYMGHDNALYCAPLSTEYRMELPSEASGALSSAGEPFVCLCDTVADTPVGRVTAPRRLNIRCRLSSHAILYGECPLGIGGMGEGTGESSSDMEILPGMADVGRVWAALGEALPLQDDLILPPSEREWRVVCAEGEVLMTEASATDGAVSTRGEVNLKITLCPAETEAEFASDTPSAMPPLTVLRRKIPFSQDVDMEGVTSACAATACGHCTDLSVQMEEGHIHLDLNVVTEARAQRSERIPYVQDLYSTRQVSTTHYTTYPAERPIRALNGNFTLSDSLALTDVGLDPAAQVVDVTAVATPGELVCDPVKGRCVLTGVCRAHLLLLRDGEYASSDMELPFRYEFDDRSESSATKEAALPFDGSVSVHNCRARMDGERISLDAELGVSLRTRCPAPLTALSDVLPEDTAPARRRGEYVICFPAPTDTLWSVAKRYHAPMAALTAANNLPSGLSPDDAESLKDVGYLIV